MRPANYTCLSNYIIAFKKNLTTGNDPKTYAIDAECGPEWDEPKQRRFILMTARYTLPTDHR